MPSQRSTYKEERQINLSVISMKRKGESALVRGDHYKERFLKKSRDYTKLEQELDSVKQELEQYKKKEKEKNDKESDGDYEKYIEREVKLQDITDDYLDKCFEKINSKHSFNFGIVTQRNNIQSLSAISFTGNEFNHSED